MGKSNFDHFQALKTVGEIYDTYDFVNTFTVADATTDYNLDSQQSDAFKNVTKARLVLIWTTEDLTIKFNSTTNPSINFPAVESPFEFRNIILVSNIFITNASGSSASVKVMLV